MPWLNKCHLNRGEGFFFLIKLQDHRVFPVKSQIFDTHLVRKWLGAEQPCTFPHLYTIKENSCNLFCNKGTVVLLNRALGVSWVQKGSVRFNLYSGYLLSYQIPSECEVNQTASLTHAACHHLHDASWFMPLQQDIDAARWRCVLRAAWQRSPVRRNNACKQVLKQLLRHFLVNTHLSCLCVQQTNAMHSLLVRSRHRKESHKGLKYEELCVWADCDLCCFVHMISLREEGAMKTCHFEPEHDSDDLPF